MKRVIGTQAAITEPGGFNAVGRGLKHTASIPPDHPSDSSRIPEECQPARSRPQRNSPPRDAATPAGVVSLASGCRGCRSGMAAAIATVQTAKTVVLTYGQQPEAVRACGEELVFLLRRNLGLCHLRLSQDGTPVHPLYRPSTLRLKPHRVTS